MFRRLKEKLSEEVSKSPLRLQSSVQSLGQLSPFKDGEAKTEHTLDTSKDSTASNSSVQNLIDLQESDSSILDAESKQFSITDEDGPISTPASPSPKPTEFTNVDLSEKDAGGALNIATNHQPKTVAMKSPVLSNPMFPVYNPTTPMYHIQSDLESASEVEDSAVNLDNINKERLYQAFQTAKSRYSSYKSRYSNAVKAYKEQVDEIGKLKAILSETQDRALRRVSELKEQSQLDQKAKAHLEDTYRVNLEEKDQLISVLHTQIRLLKNGEEIKETNAEPPLIDIEQHNDLPTDNSDSGDLRSKIERYEETIARLKGFLRNCKDTITKNREATARLNSEKEDIKKQFETAIVRLSELEQKSSQKEITLRNQNVEAHEEINRLKKSDAERGLQVAEFKKMMHDEMGSKEKEIEGLKIQLKELVLNNDELRKTIEAKSKQISELETSNNSNMNIMMSLEQMEKTSEEEKQSLLQEMSRSKAAAIELMQQEYQRNLKELKKENDEVVNQLEMEWQTKFRAKVEELELQLNAEISSKRLAEESLNEAQINCEQIDRLKEQLKTLETQSLEYVDVNSELERRKEQCVELQTQLSDEQKLKHESIQLSEQLQVQLSDAQQRLEVERTKLEKLEEAVESERKELQSSKLECSVLQAKIDDEQKLKHESFLQIEQLQMQLNEAQLRLEDDRIKLEKLSNTMESEREEFQRNIVECSELQSTLVDEQNLKRESIQLAEDLKVQLSEAQRCLTDERSKLENITENFEREREELEKRTVECTELRVKLSEEQKLKDQSIQLSEELQIQLGEVQQSLDNERSNFERLKEAVEREREGLQVAGEVEMEQLKMQLEEECRKVKNISEKRLRLKAKHEKELLEVRHQLTLELDNAKNVYHNLKSELESTKNQLEESVKTYDEQINILRMELESKIAENEVHKTANLELTELQTKFANLTEERNQLQFKFDEHLQSSGELELKMKEDHNRRLMDLKDKTKESLDALKTQMKEMQEQLENEKTSFKNLSDNCDREMKSLENMLADEKSRNEELQLRCSAAEEKAQSDLVQMTSETDGLHQKLINIEANLTECQTERDSAKLLREEMEVELSQVKQINLQTEQQISMINEEKQTLENVLNNISAALNTENETERITKLNDLQSNPLSLSLKEIFESYEARCLQLDSNCTDAANYQKLMTDECSALRDQVSLLEAQKDGFINEIQSVQDELRKVNEANVDLRINTDELKSEITSRQQEIRSLQDQNCNIVELESRLKADDEMISQLKEEVRKRQEECEAQSLEQDKNLQLHNDFRQEIENLKVEKSMLVEKMNEQKTDFDHQLKTAEDNLQKLWQSRLDKLVEDHQTKLTELKKRAENKLGQIKKQMSAETDKIRDDLMNRISGLEQLKSADENRHQEMLKRLEEDDVTISQLKQQLDSVNKEHEEKVQTLSATLQTSEVRFEQERIRLLADIEIKNSQLDESLITAQTNCTKMETEMNNLRSEFDVTKASWKAREAELEQLLNTLQEKQMEIKDIDVISQQHQTQLENLKTDYDKLLVEKEEECNSRIKTMMEESSKLIALRDEEGRQALADAIERNMSDDNRIRKEFDQQFNELQQDLIEKEQLMEQLIEEKQKILEDKNQESALANARYEEQIQLLKREHKTELDALDKKLKATMDRELQFQSRSHEDEVKGLTQEWEHERKFLTDADLNSMAEIEIVQEELQQQAELATSAVESGAQSADLLQRQIRLLQTQIETMKEQHKSEVNELHHVLKMSSHSVPPNFIQKAQYRDRQLETLEVEYLRNILYEYMMGRETMVLAKVIAAVLKFDDDQTRKILEKEETRNGGVSGPFVQLLK